MLARIHGQWKHAEAVAVRGVCQASHTLIKTTGKQQLVRAGRSLAPGRKETPRAVDLYEHFWPISPEASSVILARGCLGRHWPRM